MLFGSLFKGDKGITIGKRRKRKLTISDVVERLNSFELTTANCTMIRDHLGNEKVENYGQVDVFRVRDEEVFYFDGTICITTPTGMKLKSEVGNSDLQSMISEAETQVETGVAPADDPFAEAEAQDEEGDEQEEGSDIGVVDAIDSAIEALSDEDDVAEVDVADEEDEDGEEEVDEEEDEESANAAETEAGGGRDAYSEPQADVSARMQEEENPLGVGIVIRLRFFFRRIPYEIDCQIVDRFNPSRIPSNVDLTPRFGVGYRVRPLTDVRNRDQRRYIRYTHKVGFGHLRMRTEIQFQVYAHKTNIEIPEKGVLPPVLTHEDFKSTPFASQEVSEVKGTERLEDLVEFFMHCMVNNPTERRKVYISKPYLDRRNRSSLEGLGLFNTVGAQQTTILPKLFLKKQMTRSVLDSMLEEKGKGPRDTHKMRVIEDIQDRYSILTREQKLWQARQRQKRIESYENDTCLIGFSSAYGLTPGDVTTQRAFTMFCELTDSGLENLTMKPIPFDDARSREVENREYVRQEDGFQAELLNFSVGGAQVRGGEEEPTHTAFLKYLVGDNYDDLNFEGRIDALRKYAVLLYFYPVLTFTRAQIQDYEPYLPYKIPVIARVARFRTARNPDDNEPMITSLGLEFIYNPMTDSYSRDYNLYDQWEQITPYTENHHFIAVHKSLQLLFGFDRAMDEGLREDLAAREKDGDKKDDESEEEAAEKG